MEQELKGKTAFVTGSGRGLGSLHGAAGSRKWAPTSSSTISAGTRPASTASARTSARWSRRSRALGVRSMGVTGNIGDQAAIAAMKAEIDSKFGDVEILVNCAGGDIGASGGKPVPNDLLGIPYEDIVALTNNNLIGTMLMCQAFVNPMRAARARHRRQHRLDRGACRRAERLDLRGAEGRRRALHALPRAGGDGRRRARQLRQPRARPRPRASRRPASSIR